MKRLPLQWRKSSYSAGHGNCVEVAAAACASAVRDTQHRHLGALVFPGPEWRAFLTAAKHHTL